MSYKEPASKYTEQLETIGYLTEPAIRKAIGELDLAPGGLGLDAGCGDGRHAIWLADAMAPNGRVIGLDLSAGHVQAATRNAELAGLSDRVEFKQGNVLCLPFEDETFDFAWCADTLWPAYVDTELGVKELARVIKPGGTVALAYWTSQLFFPGYPQLEAQFNLAVAQAVPYLKVPPDQQYFFAMSWLTSTGLENVIARTFLSEACAPLTAKMSDSVCASMNMFLRECRHLLLDKDRKLFDRLCDPESDEFLLNRPDYFCFVAYTVFMGTKPDIS